MKPELFIGTILFLSAGIIFLNKNISPFYNGYGLLSILSMAILIAEYNDYWRTK